MAQKNLARALKCVVEGGEGAETLFVRLVEQSAALVPVAAVEHAPPAGATAHAVNRWLTCQMTPDGVRGRGLYAARDVSAGQVLLVEPALALLPTCKFGDDAEATRWTVGVQDEADVRDWPHRSHTFALAKRAAQRMGGGPLIDTLAAYHPSLAECPPADGEAAPDGDVASEAVAFADEVGVSVESAAALLHMVKCTAFELTAGPSSLHYGTALFPATALANHSCLPNARWIQLRDHSVLFALVPIARGQEVTGSYVGLLGSALTEPRHLSARRALVTHTTGFLCRCHLCLSHERHPDTSQPWGKPDVQRRYALVQRMCYLDESVPLESKLRVLASFLGAKSVAPSDVGEPMDDFTRMALLQWHLYLSHASVYDRPVYDVHLPVGLNIMSRLLEAVPLDVDEDQATIALKLDTLAFIWYGVVRAACRARLPGAVSIAAQCIETLAGAPMSNELCALYLASGALIDSTAGVFAHACTAILDTERADEGDGDDAAVSPSHVVPDRDKDAMPICRPLPLCD